MYRYSIIACARWETPYIAEWIAYYEAIGFEHIYLYCNDDDPAELKAEVEAATKGRPDLVSFTHFPGQGRQRDMYIAGLERARHQSEWVTFLDIDEFLVLRGCNDIGSFMESFDSTVDSVHFNWIYFGNSGFIERPAGSVLSQYTLRSSTVNATTKHLTRSALLDPDRLRQPAHPFWHGLADPVWSDLKRVNVLGADMAPLLANYPANAAAYIDPATNDAILGKAVINHYALKSEADFLLRVERGTAGQFSGQIVWKQAYESGRFRTILDTMSKVEDTYLRDLSLQRGAAKAPRITAPGPAPPLRTVHARHHLWTGDLLLGTNGRLRHADHGSLAGYYQQDGVLHVRWDKWPADLFIERDGVFISVSIPGSSSIGLRAPLSAEVNSTRVAVEATILVVPGSGSLVEVRPGSTDVDVFAAVFLAREYELSALAAPIRVILDLGANIGLSSVFFAQQYPEARVVAVEPEAGNFRLLRRNAGDWPGIIPVQAAVWPEDTTLHLQTRDADGNKMGDWGFRTVVAPVAEEAKVEALSIPTLMRRHGIELIDILKVDIEGAEFELFGRGTEAWLPFTRCVIIKTHERFRPGTEALVTERLNNDFEELRRSGENRVFVRRS